MKKSGVTSTEEGKASEKQHQINVDLFLWSEGNCAQRICSSWSNSLCCILRRSFETSTGERAKEATLTAPPWQCASLCCPPESTVFWRITTWLWCHILPTSPTLHTATFSYFQNSKWSLRGEDFKRWRIQAESQAVLNTLRENDFQECFKNWQRRWDHYQASKGDYFEGDAGP